MRKMVLIVISLTTLLVVSAHAEEECEITEAMPKGLANQGGYTFHYQSGKGKNCRGYILWNTPGGVKTPVLWKDNQETFLDGNLAKCPPDSTCPFLESIKISTRPTMMGKTTLSYGINKDEYKDEPDAYRKKPEEVTRFQPFTTILRGTVAGAHENPVQISIQVCSYVSCESPFRLTYVMTIVGKSVPLRIFRPEDIPGESSVSGLIWETAASTPFFEYLDGMEITELSGELPKVIVEITANEIELDESGLLVVLQGTERIAATTAPAYRPMGE